MLILRRITEKDSTLKYATGNKAFDEINLDGTLNNYYFKILQGIKKVIGPSYCLIGKNRDEKWGDYFLASRIVKFEPNE